MKGKRGAPGERVKRRAPQQEKQHRESMPLSLAQNVNLNQLQQTEPLIHVSTCQHQKSP